MLSSLKVWENSEVNSTVSGFFFPSWEFFYFLNYCFTLAVCFLKSQLFISLSVCFLKLIPSFPDSFFLWHWLWLVIFLRPWGTSLGYLFEISLFCLKKDFIFIILKNYVYVCRGWGVVHMSAMSAEVRGRVSDLWSWSYRQLQAVRHGCWELNSGSLQEQYTCFLPSHYLCSLIFQM